MSHLTINGVDKPLDHIRLNNVRSENLFDVSTIENGIYLAANGNKYGDITNGVRAGVKINVSPNTAYTLSAQSPAKVSLRILEWRSGTFIGQTPKYNISGDVSLTVTTGAETTEIAFNIEGENGQYVTSIMLNLGSTAKPYYPYLITKEAWEAKSRVILHGLTNPLCGIGTYKDILDLSTGTLTRYVKKLVLTGEENITQRDAPDNSYSLNLVPSGYSEGLRVNGYCTHFSQKSSASSMTDETCYCGTTAISFRMNSVTDVNSFKAYLAAQYENGTPVAVWYVLATPTTETITLPSNLTGIVEGYLTQSSTPSPTSPVYPTANGTLEQGGTYSLDTGAYAIAWGRADTFTGTDSISLRCYGLPVKSWEIDGNSQQTGTPSPQNIVMPTFCGVRTAQLFDDDNAEFGKWVNSNGSIATNATYAAGYDIKVGTASEFAVKYYGDKPYSYSMAFYDNNGDFMSRIHRSNPSASYDVFPVPGNAVSARFQVAIDTSDVITSALLKAMKLMLNLGSTAIPYEPYGWAEKITCAGQTVPVYLGQVSTVRKIKKLVLTGEEIGINKHTSPENSYSISIYGNGWSASTIGYGISSHFVRNGTVANLIDGEFYVGSTAFSFRLNDCTDAAAFITYLRQQYAAGTPVTVWYVLAEPTTGIVNEPLAKIGNYVDTLTSDQAGVTIPTTDGSTTISVDTTLAPSKFEVKVHAKPIS